jgi:hypothetical protein
MQIVTDLGEPLEYNDIHQCVLRFCKKHAWRFRPYQSVDADDLTQIAMPHVLKAIKSHDPNLGKWQNRVIATTKWRLQDEFKRLKRQARRDDVGKGLELESAAANDDRDVYDRLPKWVRDDSTACLAALAKGLNAIHGPKQSASAGRPGDRDKIAALLIVRRHLNLSLRGAVFLFNNSLTLQKVLDFRTNSPAFRTLHHVEKTWANPPYIEWLYAHAAQLAGVTRVQKKPVNRRAKVSLKSFLAGRSRRVYAPAALRPAARPRLGSEASRVASPHADDAQYVLRW